MAEIKQIGGFAENKRKDGTYQTGYAVYDKEDVCPTLLANGGGYGIMIIEETTWYALPCVAEILNTLQTERLEYIRSKD